MRSHRSTRTIRKTTCALCHHTIRRNEPRKRMLIYDVGPFSVHATCADSYQRGDYEILDLLHLLDQEGW